MAVLNQHPPSLNFLQPEPDVATTLADGERFFRFKLDVTNVFLRELDSGIIADYDYEEMRATLDYTMGMPDGELSIELPISYRGRGVMDDLIDAWHEVFGLQRGIRANYPAQGYRYVIATRDGLVYNGESDTLGIGDLAVTYKHPLWQDCDGEDAFSLRGSVKLPTGDPDKALGSGNFDAGIGALWQKQLTPHWRGYASADYIFIGEPDWENVGWQDVIQTNWTLEWAVKNDTTVVTQFRTMRNPLRIGSREADKDSQTLGVGVNHRLDDSRVLTLGFDEDINPETAPDFIVVAHMKWDF